MSTRSGSQPSPIAMPRPICATSNECVSRVRGVSLWRGPTTCVLSASRRSAAQCSTLARSRAKSVRCSESVPGNAATLRRLDHQALPVELVVCVLVHRHRRTVCQDSSPVPGVPACQRTTLTIMRIARLLSLVLAILAAGVLLAPTAGSTPPFRLPGYVTDQAKALSGSQVQRRRAGRRQALHRPPGAALGGVRRQLRQPRRGDLGRKNQANKRLGRQRRHPGRRDPGPLLCVPGADGDRQRLGFQRHSPQCDRTQAARQRLGRRRGRRRRGPEHRRAHRPGNLAVRRVRRAGHPRRPGAAAVAVDAAAAAQAPGGRVRRGTPRRPADPNALASVQIDALDDLSKSMVVDVDNAVRTSDNELALAVEEFGDKDTSPFSKAVVDARTTLAQAFNVRQILDDAVPETIAQRRDLLTRVVVAAAKADHELDTQREAFAQLRDLVINAPSRLDSMTQQMVDLTARLEPSQQALTALHDQFADTALASVAGNVETAKQRLAFADQNITNAREPALAAGGSPGQGSSTPFAQRSRHSVRRAHCWMRCRVQRPTSTARSLPCRRRSPTSRTASRSREISWRRATRPTPKELGVARDSAVKAVADAQGAGTSRSVGRLHQVDAGRRRAGPAAGKRRRRTRGGRAAQPRIRPGAVRRSVKGSGGVGLHRRRAAAASARRRAPGSQRRCGSCRPRRTSGETNLNEAIAHANGAAMLASQAQSMATRTRRRHSAHTPGNTAAPAETTWARCSAASSSATSSVGGSMRGGLGGSMGGGWSSTSYGGSGWSGGLGGGGGRFSGRKPPTLRDDLILDRRQHRAFLALCEQAVVAGEPSVELPNQPPRRLDSIATTTA